jgi:hypothetical protein
MDRGDAARSGRSLPLPRPALHVAWRRAIGTYADRAPVVDARGGSYIVGVRGDMIALSADGVERWRVATGATQPGPLALLSDDTVVFADANGQAVAVRDGAMRWRAQFGRADVDTASPLPLEDGGVVVATTRELAVLDSEGNERARTALPEPIGGPLLWSAGHVVVVATSGCVWKWAPGTTRAERVGSFGSAVDSGAVLADGRTLLAVAARDSSLRALDLVHGDESLRAMSSRDGWRGPLATLGGIAFVVSMGASGEHATAVDSSGEELARAVLAARSAPVAIGSADAGLAVAPIAGPTPPLVDPSGAMAFGTSEGAVGVALFPAPAASRANDAAPTVGVIVDACPLAFGAGGGPSAVPRAVAGLAALPGKRLLAVCRSGAVLAIGGSVTSELPAKAL